MACCKSAHIETKTVDAAGNEIDHVDIHSLRRTFTTDAIQNGANPKSVQEILGHRTLEMTMKAYAKANSQIKRHAIGKLSYGRGSQPPRHVVEYPPLDRLNGHQMVTTIVCTTDELPQVIAG
jgi:hypothetical protein